MISSDIDHNSILENHAMDIDLPESVTGTISDMPGESQSLVGTNVNGLAISNGGENVVVPPPSNSNDEDRMEQAD
ncbi:hypothetical protein SLA2020_464330 [Shorea laevis]